MANIPEGRDQGHEKEIPQFKLFFVPPESERMGKGQFIIEGKNKRAKLLILKLYVCLHIGSGDRLMFPVIGLRDKIKTQKLALATMEKLTDGKYLTETLEPLMAGRNKVTKELFADIERITE